MPACSTKSASTSRRFSLARGFDSLTTRPAPPLSLANRRGSRASALPTCATQFARRRPAPSFSRCALPYGAGGTRPAARLHALDEPARLAGAAEVGDALIGAHQRNGRAAARAGLAGLHMNSQELA